MFFLFAAGFFVCQTKKSERGSRTAWSQIISLSASRCQLSLQIFSFFNFLKFYQCCVSFYLPLGLFMYPLLSECFSFWSRDVVLLPLKKFCYFFSCFLLLEVVSPPLRTSISRALGAGVQCLLCLFQVAKAGNSGGLPSLSLLVFPYFMSVNHLFGHFLGPFLQFTGHAY